VPSPAAPSPDAPLPDALDLGLPAVELTRRLVDLESVSGHEGPIADAVEAALRALRHLTVLRDGDAVIARTALGRSSRVVIAGHLDTVPVNGNLPSRLESGSDGDVLWGRGTVDMKGGCAVMLALAASIAEPVVDVTWVFYDHEEVDSSLNGLGRVARNQPGLLAADFAILGEPTGGVVAGGCNGTLRADVGTRGRRAHSARSWMGDNAIHSLAPVLAVLAAYRPESIEVDGLVYREGLNAVGISGGVAGIVIPDEAVVTINYRFAPSRDAAQAEAVVRELFAGFEVEVTDVAAGARPGLDDPITQTFMATMNNDAKPKYS